MDEGKATASGGDAPSGYWDATPFARVVREEFVDAVASRRLRDAEHRYEVIGTYCRRTLGIARAALEDGDDPLATRALLNFLVLHDATVEMRRLAPRLVPDTSVAGRRDRAHLLEDHIVEVLDTATRPLSLAELAGRLVDGGRTPEGEVRLLAPRVDALVDSGHLRRDDAGRLVRTGVRHQGLERGSAAFALLVGPRLGGLLHEAGVRSVVDVAGDPEAVSAALLGRRLARRETVDALVAVAGRLAHESGVAMRSTWPPPGLRGYQRDAFRAFRDGGYAGLVVDAPAGSGKTLIGAMCVVDWLEHIAPGQTVLVLAPTSIIQRQWVRELCFAPVGPLLAPHLVGTGTISTLLAARSRRHATPAVIVMTYSAVADAASRDGEFRPAVLERLLLALDVRFLLLDEVHVAAERPDSITARAVRRFSEWRTSGRVRGIVGMSATSAPFAERLAELGLTIEVVVDDLDLVAGGQIAPFAEAGVAFGYSERERRLRELVTAYRDELRSWLRAVGGEGLRSWYAAIPMATRVEIARRLLRLRSTTPDHEAGLVARLTRWEVGGPVRLGELALVSIVQVAYGWSDADLAANAANADGNGSAESRARDALRSLARLRADAAGLVIQDGTRRRLHAAGFGRDLDGARLRGLLADEHLSATDRWAGAREVLATTAVGAYASLRDDARRVGEGRVHTIAAIVDAERAARRVTGVVVFERGGALHVDDHVARPDHRGVAGTFAGLLGHTDLTTMAVLPGELYLPARSPSISTAIATYLRTRVLAVELPRLLVELVSAGLDLDAERRAALDELAGAAVTAHLDEIGTAESARVDAVHRTVLQPLRRLARRWSRQPGLTPADAAALRDRLARRHLHLRDWVGAFCDHVALASRFDRPVAVRVHTAGGARHAIEVVRLPGGTRRQLAYELVRRLLDGDAEPGVPAIDVAVVSSWARGGWNVVTPNVLIDATATRDAVAWQQLRGRALRPWASWTPERAERLAAARTEGPHGLDRAVRLLTTHNKVAHVYELLRGHGSHPQVVPGDDGRWRRDRVLAAKHRRGSAVDLRTGEHGRGEGHAGLIVAADPRVDTPDELHAALVAALRGADSRIVRGWLRAAAGRYEHGLTA